MPVITVQITNEGNTPGQKAELIRGMTAVIVRVLNKPPALTHVLLEEVALDNWGVAGLPTQEFRKQSTIH